MLHLFQSSQFDALATQLAMQIDAQRNLSARGPLEVIQIVVPHPRVGTWLTIEIAKKLGIAANLRFVSLEESLEEALNRAVPGRPHRIWERRALRARLLSLLGDQELMSHDDLGPIRRYLQASSKGDQERADQEAAMVRRYQLADRIAGLFERYLRESAPMIGRWQEDALCFEESPSAQSERWQRVLLLRLLNQYNQEGGYRWVTWRQACEVLRARAKRSSKMWHFFGIEYMGDVLYEALDALSQSDILFFYMFNPCREFWGDLRFGRADEEELLSSASVHGGGVEYQGEDDFWHDMAHAPFGLRAWGFAGARHLRGLEQIEGVGITMLDEDGDEEGLFEQDDLLSRIKSHTLTLNRTRGDLLAQGPSLELKVLATSHIKREVEVIASSIWETMQSFREQGKPLRFQDITLLIPKAKRDLYQTHIRAIFPRTHQIPFSMVDMPAGRWSRAIEAVQMLLKLPFGRFRRQELLRLMTHPNVIGQFPYANPEDWVTWCERLKILHGADRKDHADTYIETELFHWDQGLKRLTLGAFMGEEVRGGRRAFMLGEKYEYLPCEYGQEQGRSAARFILLAKSLIQDAKFCRHTMMPMSQWAHFMSQMISTYLDATTDREDEMILHRCRQLLAKLDEQEISGMKVPYRLAYEAAIDLLSELEVQRGQHLLDGVCVMGLEHGSLQPSEVTFIAGLTDGEFPEPEIRRPEDLCFAMDRQGQLIQVQGQLPHPSEREAQKYGFLKALMNARSRVVLSYVAWDARTAEERPPSGVVEETLQSVAQLHEAPQEEAYEWAKHRLVLKHPEKRFDPEYFPSLYPAHQAGPESAELTPSYQPQAEQEAIVGALREDLDQFKVTHEVQGELEPALLEAALEQPVWQGLKSRLGIVDPPVNQGWQEETLKLSLSDIRAFLECPLQGSARVLLRLEQDSQEEEAMLKESEIFEPSASVRIALLREVFWDKLSREHNEQNALDFDHFYDGKARLLELDGTLPTGPFYTAARERHLRILNLWQDNLPLLGLGTSPRMEVHRFGRPQENEHLDVLHEPLQLSVEVEGQPLTIELSGKTESIIQGHNTSVIPNLTGHVAKLSPKYFMRGFLDYVFLAANTMVPQQGLPWSVHISPAEEVMGYKQKYCSRKFQPLEAERAQGYLQGVVTDMLSHVHAYYMPIEAVFEHMERRQPFHVVAERKRADNWNQTSSDWGPVRDARRFEPPEDGERMAFRRFALYFDKLSKGR